MDDEDIHMGVESRLIKKIGDVGKKLHTSRSRNDQCQVDTRLYLRKEIYEILNSLCYLESVILKKAREICESDHGWFYSSAACTADHHRIHLYGIFPDVQA